MTDPDIYRLCMRRPPRTGTPLLLLVLLVSAVVALAASQGTVKAAAVASSDSCPPLTAQAPSVPGLPAKIPAPPQRILACVGAWAIRGATFNHWEIVAGKTEAPRHHPSATIVKLRIVEAMEFLVRADWVLEEAQRQRVDVSPRTVRRTFDRIRRERFPGRAEFRAYLKEGGQTVADLLMRVRLMLLTQVLRGHLAPVKTGVAPTPAFEELVRSLSKTWRAQTYCEPAFATLDCGQTAP